MTTSMPDFKAYGIVLDLRARAIEVDARSHAITALEDANMVVSGYHLDQLLEGALDLVSAVGRNTDRLIAAMGCADLPRTPDVWTGDDPVELVVTSGPRKDRRTTMVATELRPAALAEDLGDTTSLGDEAWEHVARTLRTRGEVSTRHDNDGLSPALKDELIDADLHLIVLDRN